MSLRPVMLTCSLFGLGQVREAILLSGAAELAAAGRGIAATGGAKGVLPPLRQAYVNEVKALEDVALNMRAASASPEQVARQLHQMRRDLGVQYKDLTPAPQLEVIYARNLEKYGDKLGPTVDWLRAKGKSWEQIISLRAGLAARIWGLRMSKRQKNYSRR